MTLLGAVIMDTDRIIPQNGSSPGSQQSSQGQPHQYTPQQQQQPQFNGVSGSSYPGSNIRMKKKGDRTVAPPPPHILGNSYANTTPSYPTPSNGLQQYQYNTYSPADQLNGGLRSGLTNHGFTRDIG